MSEDQLTDVVAIRRYFFEPSAKAGDIYREIKELTPEDKAELAEGARRELAKVADEAGGAVEK